MSKLTREEITEWLAQNRPELELIFYGGGEDIKSLFRCSKEGCAKLWSTTFASVKNGDECPKETECITYEEEESESSDTVEEVQKPKRRGRPRKNVEDNVVKEPKKRGRPRKKVETETATEPKRRGRPRKSSENNAEKESKRRGRPRITDENVREWLKNHRPEIELVEYGGNNAKKSKFRDVESGVEFESSKYSIMRGKGKPMRVVNVAMSEQKVRDWLAENRPNIELVTYSGKTVKKSVFRCVTDCCEFETTVAEIKRGYVCPECRKNERKKRVVEWLEEYCPYIELVEYSGNNISPSVFRFWKGNGHTWKKSINAIKHGQLNRYKLSCVTNVEE